MFQQTWQDVTYQDYPIQCQFSLSSKAEGADIIAEMGGGKFIIYLDKTQNVKGVSFLPNFIPSI